MLFWLAVFAPLLGFAQLSLQLLYEWRFVLAEAEQNGNVWLGFLSPEFFLLCFIIVFVFFPWITVSYSDAFWNAYIDFVRGCHDAFLRFLLDFNCKLILALLVIATVLLVGAVQPYTQW